MNINLETSLAIIGIIISLILGFLGLRYTFKFRRKPNLIFLKNNSVSLFERIVKNLDDLEIKFKGEKIKENLILFQGTFFNFGNVDIDKSIIHKPVEINLPKSYNWVQFKLVGGSKDLDISFQRHQNKIVFDWDLLKEGEYFTFDSIIEYNSNDKEKNEEGKIEEQLLDQIEINHRIKDLKSIEVKKSFPEILSNVTIGFCIFLNLLLMLYAAHLASVPIFSSNYRIYNEVNLTKETQPEYLRLVANDENQIALKNAENDEIKIVSKEELEKILSKKLKIERREVAYSLIIIYSILMIIIFIIQIKYLLIPEFQARKLNKKLKKFDANWISI